MPSSAPWVWASSPSGMIAVPHVVSLKVCWHSSCALEKVPNVSQVGAGHSSALQVFLDTPFLILSFFSSLFIPFSWISPLFLFFSIFFFFGGTRGASIFFLFPFLYFLLFFPRFCLRATVGPTGLWSQRVSSFWRSVTAPYAHPIGSPHWALICTRQCAELFTCAMSCNLYTFIPIKLPSLAASYRWESEVHRS